MQLSSIPLSRVVPQLWSLIVAITGISRCGESALCLTSNAEASKEGMVSNPTPQGANQSSKKKKNGTEFIRHICLPDNSRIRCAESAEN